MIALRARFRLFFEKGGTRVTGPFHSGPRLAVLPLQWRVQFRWRLRIAGVSIGVFVEFRRLSRAHFTAYVLTAGTGLVAPNKGTLAEMTGPPH